jgi:hypothetical protein
MTGHFRVRLWLLAGIILVASPILAAAQAPDQIRVPTGDVDSFWDNLAFAELTPAERKAWAILGWNAGNWDAAADVPDTVYVLWIQLSDEQQAVATALGYSQRYWDSIGFTKPTGDVNEFWDTVAYSVLTPTDRNAWAALGWNAKNWDYSAGVPDTSFMPWSHLSAVQQAAATALGYSQNYWDFLVIRKPSGDVNAFWSGISWEDLTLAEQKAWAVLGWNVKNWVELADPADLPETEYMYWAQLSQEQRLIATKLGYGKEYWDATVKK